MSALFSAIFFPAGCLSSIEAVARNVARHVDLNIAGVEDITQHCSRTLQEWYDRFSSRARV